MARLALVVALLGLGPTPARASAPQEPSGFSVELEGGALWQSRQDVAVPGDTGTRFDLGSLLGGGAWPVGRLTLQYDFAERHSLRFVAAPIGLEGSGALAEPTSFAGTLFAPGVDTEGEYRFDTYRIGYRWHWLRRERWNLWVGATGLLRDAEITLRQPGLSATKSNTGFVPLLHVDADWRFAPRWRLVADLDGLASPQGRAFDFSLKAAWALGERWELAAGYRTIEGGADNDDVYTFAWLHAAVVSLRWSP